MQPHDIQPLVTADFQMLTEREWMTKLAIIIVVLGVQCLLAWWSERRVAKPF